MIRDRPPRQSRQAARWGVQTSHLAAYLTLLIKDSARELGGQDLTDVDLGVFGEQLVLMGHELGGDLAIEVLVGTVLFGEGVEDVEGALVLFDRQLHRHKLLLFRHGDCLGEEGLEFIGFPPARRRV